MIRSGLIDRDSLRPPCFRSTVHSISSCRPGVGAGMRMRMRLEASPYSITIYGTLVTTGPPSSMGHWIPYGPALTVPEIQGVRAQEGNFTTTTTTMTCLGHNANPASWQPGTFSSAWQSSRSQRSGPVFLNLVRTVGRVALDHE